MKKLNFYQILFLNTNNKELILAIGKKYSRSTLYIPKNLHEDHPLVAYGKDFIEFVQKHYSGKNVYVPMLKEKEFLKFVSKNQRRKKIGSLFYKLKSLIIRYSNF